jgi:two-component system, LytTR family, response regulator
MEKELILIGGRIKVDPDEVVAMVACENYCRVLMLNGKEILSSTTLGLVASRFKDGKFVRTHRSYLINMDFLKKYDEEHVTFAFMENNLRVTISRRKRQGFIDRLAI